MSLEQILKSLFYTVSQCLTWELRKWNPPSFAHIQHLLFGPTFIVHLLCF